MMDEFEEEVRTLARRIEDALYVNARVIARIQQVQLAEAHADREWMENQANISNEINDKLIAAKLLARQFDATEV